MKTILLTLSLIVLAGCTTQNSKPSSTFSELPPPDLYERLSEKGRQYYDSLSAQEKIEIWRKSKITSYEFKIRNIDQQISEQTKVMKSDSSDKALSHLIEIQMLEDKKSQHQKEINELKQN
jgi:predicted RND superfamily exporter protein